MNTWLFILSFALVPTVLYLALWLNRKRIVRWAIRRHAGQADRLITQARIQRLINARDEQTLRREYECPA
jgi:hypothetical protein